MPLEPKTLFSLGSRQWPGVPAGLCDTILSVAKLSPQSQRQTGSIMDGYESSTNGNMVGDGVKLGDDDVGDSASAEENEDDERKPSSLPLHNNNEGNGIEEYGDRNGNEDCDPGKMPWRDCNIMDSSIPLNHEEHAESKPYKEAETQLRPSQTQDDVGKSDETVSCRDGVDIGSKGNVTNNGEKQGPTSRAGIERSVSSIPPRPRSIGRESSDGTSSSVPGATAVSRWGTECRIKGRLTQSFGCNLVSDGMRLEGGPPEVASPLESEFHQWKSDTRDAVRAAIDLQEQKQRNASEVGGSATQQHVVRDAIRAEIRCRRKQQRQEVTRDLLQASCHTSKQQEENDDFDYIIDESEGSSEDSLDTGEARVSSLSRSVERIRSRRAPCHSSESSSRQASYGNDEEKAEESQAEESVIQLTDDHDTDYSSINNVNSISFGSHVTARTITREELEQEVLGTFLQQAVSAIQVLPIPRESHQLSPSSGASMNTNNLAIITSGDAGPSMCDVDTLKNAENAYHQRSNYHVNAKLLVIVGCLMMVVVALTVILTAEIAGTNDAETVSNLRSPTSAPTKTPQPLRSSKPSIAHLDLYDLTLQKFLKSHSWWEDRDDFAVSNTSSPQFRAMLWMSKEDAMFLQLIEYATQGIGHGLNDFDDRDGPTSLSSSSNSTATFWEPLMASLRLEEAIVLQRYAMATIYFSTGGTNWTNNANWLSSLNVCEWYMATHEPTCDDASDEDYQPNNHRAGTINRVELGGLGLTGTLPNEIVFLMEYAELESIGLANNELHGTVPRAWGGRGGRSVVVDETATTARERSILRRLDLTNNHLSGTVPAEWIDMSSSSNASGFLIHHSLEELKLGGNRRLSGDISDILWRLTSLQHVDLSYLPNLSLELSPSNARHLTDMRHFVASEGLKLLGSLPTELGLWSNLVALDLHATSRAGDSDPTTVFRTSIPTELWELTSLQLLDLSGLLLSGTFPSVEGLTSLEKLNLGGNRLNGTIPSTIGSWTDLRELDLSSNPVLGSGSTIPTAFARLTSLRKLDLSNCDFSGNLFSEIGSLVELQKFSIRNNRLMSGPLITELGRLTELEELDFANCLISGNIPTELGELIKLKKLHLSGTVSDDPIAETGANGGLSGTIPNELKKLKQLQKLYLDHNRLTGPLPEVTVAAMAKLQVLHFQNNQFSSTLPQRWVTALNEIGTFFDILCKVSPSVQHLAMGDNESAPLSFLNML